VYVVVCDAEYLSILIIVYTINLIKLFSAENLDVNLVANCRLKLFQFAFFSHFVELEFNIIVLLDIEELESGEMMFGEGEYSPGLDSLILA
jgi:hypothetical protein